MASTHVDMPERDALTGLVAIDCALAQIDAWIAAASDVHEIAPVHAMLLGLRRFEAVNLAFGEAAGDSALTEVTARLLHFAADEFSGDWLVSRAGGGNFLIAAAEPCSRERWQWLAEELAASVARPIPNQSGQGTVRLWPRFALMRVLPEENGEGMLNRLVETLERAKAHSGHRILWVDGDMTVPGRTTAQLEADLLTAIDRDEIEIVFQPQYSTEDGTLVGAEALARWQHPKLGRIGAGALFSIAERADHVAQLSHHIASRALAYAAKWPEHLRLSLNITPADLAAGRFASEFAATLYQSGIPAERLTLEITEQALLTDLDSSAEALQALVDKGIRIALDDFGAGFCNFHYLKRLPLHYLKLDRSMVDGIAGDAKDLAVLRGIVALAHALDLEVLAEGIETQAQLDIVRQEGCAYFQGFLKAEPMDANEFAKLATA